ncbi:COX assembly mitochondrial protein homolog [Microplitis mediator]|uniref:COX assembly mitochondrial protein homolog n=1 Tax=Microplitis mediator TaxID=375433 RepID=UPI0025573B61|nr:COX assembly mitochondrial protein homolog [Microplitis mediator]
MMENETEKKVKKSVLPRRHGGGPHNLGDPDDQSLRKVEKDILIPKKIRERARTEKCVDEVKALTECGKAAGLAIVYKCREENQKMWDCYEKWYHDQELIDQCTKEYLNERTIYRRTGIGAKYQKEHGLT